MLAVGDRRNRGFTGIGVKFVDFCRFRSRFSVDFEVVVYGSVEYRSFLGVVVIGDGVL